MSKVLIEISELRKSVGGDAVKELADFLEDKLDVEVEMTGGEVQLSVGEERFSRSHLRVLLRKFLHREELEDFRIISGKENSFIVKERKSVT